jgi:DNA polymerase elongation subunit (family B)
MSTETFIGQFHEEERAWAGIRAMDQNEWTLDLGGFTAQGGSTSFTLTGAEWHAWLREQNFMISAFGTVFDQNKIGMLSDTLTFWFTERKRLQAEKKKYTKLAKAEADPAKKLELEKLEEHFDLLQLTKKIQLNSAYGATLNEAFRFGRREIGASITGTGRQITTHMIQTIAHIISGRKVKLMKRYALGSHDRDGNELEGRRGKFFFGEYSGLYHVGRGRNAGRKITAPYAQALMDGNAGALMDGLPKTPEYTWEKNSETGEMYLAPTGAIYFCVFEDDLTICKDIIYGDTDSCYFKTHATNYEDAVATADEIAAQVNASFPAFMREAFNCTEDRSQLIKAAREIVADRGLFLMTKKKYTLNVVNLDGFDMRDKPKLKSMGSEIKKADTPKVVQDFLKGLMKLVLAGEAPSALEEFVNSHRGSLIGNTKDVLELAPAKQVNNLDALYAEYKRTEKVRNGKMKHCPGHVRAAINYNEYSEMFEPGVAKPLKAGDKAAILYLKPNAYDIKSMGFPAEMTHLPAWFKEHFQVDLKVTEEKMIDSKIDGIFEALQLEVPTPQNTFVNAIFDL